MHTDRKPVRKLTEKLHKETIARLVRKDRSSFHSAIDDMDGFLNLNEVERVCGRVTP